MQIGVLKDTTPFEKRIAVTPDTIKKYLKAGHSVVIEQGAGEGSFITHDAMQQAGANVVANATDVLSGSDIILTVNSLPPEQIRQLKPNAVVIGMMNPYRNEHLADYANQNASVYALELLPRTLSRAQNMDVLSSQANLAGYKAVLLAANEYGRPFPMFMTSAGTVKPARVVILGVGVAGLQAIATARRLGAVVEASDLRPAAKDQVESLGGKWLDVPMSDEEKAKAQSTGGYAWTPSEQYVKDQAAIVDKAVSQADIVITTAQIPGRNAPRLIHQDTIDKMKSGAVILDMAVETGGNVAGSQVGQNIVTPNGVTIMGVPNIPSTLAAQSSALYANNVYNFFATLVDDNKAFTLNPDEEIQKALLVTHQGQVLLAK